jgi:hypothetical protein
MSEDLQRRAVILHVVALNFWVRFRKVDDDERIGAACSVDWARRVMCAFNFA